MSPSIQFSFPRPTYLPKRSKTEVCRPQLISHNGRPASSATRYTMCVLPVPLGPMRAHCLKNARALAILSTYLSPLSRYGGVSFGTSSVISGAKVNFVGSRYFLTSSFFDKACGFLFSFDIVTFTLDFSLTSFEVLVSLMLLSVYGSKSLTRWVTIL